MTESTIGFVLRRSLSVISVLMLLPAVACSGPVATQTAGPTAPALAQTAIPTPAGSIEAPVPPTEGDAVTLSIEGHTVVVNGSLDDGFYERFLSLVQGREDEITTLRVNSAGGKTDEGIKLGHWIFEHGIDVVVDGLCFSSCANYIFTAGRNKTIMADSIVGWHGSEQQDEHLARGLGLTVEELLAQQYDELVAEGVEPPSPERRKKFVEVVLSRRPAAVGEEQALLERIGVNVDALVYGFLPDRFQGYYINRAAHIDGWTFSIEGMARFGINNVTYAGDGDYPRERATEEYGVVLFSVPREECIVFGYDSEYGDDSYTASICSRTAPLRQTQVHLDALGDGRAPRADGGPALKQTMESHWWTFRRL